MRKKLIKVYLSKEQRRFLKRIAGDFGIGESEVLRQAFMEYAKSVSLITETIRVGSRSFQSCYLTTVRSYVPDFFVLCEGTHMVTI